MKNRIELLKDLIIGYAIKVTQYPKGTDGYDPMLCDLII